MWDRQLAQSVAADALLWLLLWWWWWWWAYTPVCRTGKHTRCSVDRTRPAPWHPRRTADMLAGCQPPAHQLFDSWAACWSRRLAPALTRLRVCSTTFSPPAWPPCVGWSGSGCTPPWARPRRTRLGGALARGVSRACRLGLAQGCIPPLASRRQSSFLSHNIPK
jgi:hypothetical protein